MTYIDALSPNKMEEYEMICKTFFEAARMSHPKMLNKQKIHLILHLPEVMRNFRPMSAYNTER